ncbi:hypothetical protein FQN60_004559, partial [Etheostoma spectabile]
PRASACISRWLQACWSLLLSDTPTAVGGVTSYWMMQVNTGQVTFSQCTFLKTPGYNQSVEMGDHSEVVGLLRPVTTIS